MSVVSAKEKRGKEGIPIADLHLHSTYSDGACSPCELVKRASDLGLSTISITDHDCVTGFNEAAACAKEHGINLISGIELNATLNGREIHILGYFIDTANSELLQTTAYLREQRLERGKRIVRKLNQLNIPVTMESVLSFAGAGSVGRPHIAEAVFNGGYVNSYLEVFEKYLGDGAPAYEEKVESAPEALVKLISKAGGLSILAHPGKNTYESDLLSLVQAGIDGIEVIHPSHSQELVQYYRAIVNQYCLLETGGSDFHGGSRADDYNFGQIYIHGDIVDQMRRRLPGQVQQE
jgi:3',5'-nucleoside bisphosphate phosphatase